MTRMLTYFSLLIAMLSFQAGCENKHDQNKHSEVLTLLKEGEYSKASEAAVKLLANPDLSATEKSGLDSIFQICQRVHLDFNLSESDLLNRLEKYRPGISRAELQILENEHKIDYLRVDGVKKYFRNSVRNLFLLDSSFHNLQVKRDGNVVDSLPIFRLSHTAAVIGKTRSRGECVCPVRMKLSYTVTVDANAVPTGETIRCWMPFTRENHPRQKDVRLLSSNPVLHSIAPPTDQQRTVYLEKKAVENQPTLFQTELEFTSYAQFFDLSPEIIQPYHQESELYKRYTAEKPPHIIFTDTNKKLLESILQKETNPLLQVRKIYGWINDSITWASAIEYSILPDIPGFVLQQRHGDCGMQTLLFMTLARSAGIPVKWQSGWMLHPGNVNLHDWCEVYFEGIGWVPLDQSFGLQNTADQRLRDFYSTGIDAYRFIVNDEIAEPLSPVKKYLRSEPYDFQRGEVEWSGGNLYFDKWSWHMDVSYQYL